MWVNSAHIPCGSLCCSTSKVSSLCMYVSPLMYHCVFLLLAEYKNTALHLHPPAAQGGHLNMVNCKFLVPRFGVRVYKKNFFHQTCRDLAEVEGHQHVVEYLLCHCVTESRGCDDHPSHATTQKERMTVVAFLSNPKHFHFIAQQET